tara:strand:- start:207 stop:1463 length:1257 start_codon:yes stop_codon:yes gene_type:complete
MKPNILLLGDDLRTPTGVGNICKDLVTSTLNDFNWIQIACKQNHPDNGKIIDISKSISERYKVEGSFVRLYCSSSYGDEYAVKNIIESEKIDLILHITDPRYYSWLYSIENEIRKSIPICYYHVWDNYPIPIFNEGVYKSCDWIGCISKLTYNVVSEVLQNTDKCDYVPHGVDINLFKKLDDDIISGSRKNLLKQNCEFAFLVNNANMRRKQLPTIIEAFSKMIDDLPTDKKNHVMMMMHTNVIGEGGHDLIKMCDSLYPKLPVLFSTTKVNPETLNQMYNTFSTTINIASNEGFGLSTLESLATQTPIICNRTGGLSEQIDDNNTWGIGIEPETRKLSGDKHTPYLYEDFVSASTLAEAMLDMTNKSPTDLSEMGIKGRDYVEKNYNLDNMVTGIRNGISNTLGNFKSAPSYRIERI